MIHYIESNKILEEIEKNGQKLTIILFCAKWSIPCDEQIKILSEISDSYCYEAEFYRVDIDESQDVKIRYEVNSTPIIIFCKDGQEIERCIGLTKENDIIDLVEELK